MLAEELVENPISLVYTVVSGILFLCFVTQSLEFHSAGISADGLLHLVGWLGGSDDPSGSENLLFLQFHVKRTTGVLVVHSLLPFLYLIGNFYYVEIAGNQEATIKLPNWLLSLFLAASFLLPLACLAVACCWRANGWLRHPIVKKLLVYAADDNEWEQVATDINNEFRRVEKLVVSTNPVAKVVVTDNWIVQTGHLPWKFNVVHQSDVVKLEIVKSDNFIFSATDGGGSQYLTINVENRRTNVKSFSFRLNSLEYQNLQDRIRCQIFNLDNVDIFKSVSERFVQVFKEHVDKNPRVQMEVDLEPCIGCMLSTPNVTLKRRCSSDASDRCVNCYCRPMWCVDCLGKWFASRQDQQRSETWLGAKCPCPTCRSKFCILDVSFIDS